MTFRLNGLSCSMILLAVAFPRLGRPQATSASPYQKTRSEQSFSAGAFLWMTLRDPLHGTVQGTTRNAGAEFDYHQQFRPSVGYRVNFGFTKTGEIYGGTAGQQTGVDIPTRVYEVSSTYVVQQPQNTSHWRAFAELGPGLLSFVPSGYPFAGHSNVHAAAVYGAGATFQPGKRYGLRVEYRGYFYQNPTFAAGPVGFDSSKFPTFTAGPALSVTYHFR